MGMDQEKQKPCVNTITITADVSDKIVEDSEELHLVKGQGAVKMTLEIKPGFTIDEVLEHVREIFQKTTKCLEQFL